MICLQKNTIAALLAAVLFAGTAACAAELTDRVKQSLGWGDPVAGKSESSLCQGCHGEEGISFVDLIPDLAGQYAPILQSSCAIVSPERAPTRS